MSTSHKQPSYSAEVMVAVWIFWARSQNCDKWLLFFFSFAVWLAVHLSIFISVINQIDAHIFLFSNKSISCLYMFRAHVLIFFFFFSSTSLYDFWLAQLFSSIASSFALSVSTSSLPSFSDHFSRRFPILILAFLSGAHHQEVKITLHSLWYHHTYRWPSGAQVETELVQPVISEGRKIKV